MSYIILGGQGDCEGRAVKGGGKVTHGTTYDAVQIQVFDLRNSFCH